MAQGIWLKAGGGVGSDDVTALKSHVLRGFTTITSDSNDEITEGTITTVNTKDNNYMIGVVSSSGLYWDTQRQILTVHLPFQNAYYYREDNSPQVSVKFDDLGTAQPYEVVAGVTFTSKNGLKISGTIPNRGGESTALNVWWENGNLMTAFNEGVYGRHHDDTNNSWRWSPRVRLAGSHLGNARADWVQEGVTFTSENGLRVSGTMKLLNPLVGDLIAPWNNEVIVWDSHYNGFGGRKLLAKVPAWWRLGAINWVAVDAPNYRPENIRAGVAMPGGLVGSMEHPEPIRNQLNNTTNELNNVRNQLNNTTNELNQYRNSKVAFNSATFDGYLLSGVAEKGFVAKGEIFFYNSMNDYGYKGIYDGGLNLKIGTTFLSNQYYAEQDYGIGITPNTSVNLTHYRQVVVSYRHIYTIVSPYALSFNRSEIAIHGYIGRASSKKADYTVGIQRGAGKPQGAYLVGECADVLASKIEIWQSSRMSSHSSPEHLDTSGQLIIDVSSINEHCFLSLGVILNKTGSDASTFGRTIITKIEFLN